MPLYKGAIAAATTWGTAVAPGANQAIPMTRERLALRRERAGVRAQTAAAVYDRGEVKTWVASTREVGSGVDGLACYPCMHPALLMAFGAVAETPGSPLTTRRYGTMFASPQQFHTLSFDRRSAVWAADTAICRRFNVEGMVGKPLGWSVDFLAHDVDPASAYTPSSWTYEGGLAALDLPVMFTPTSAQLLIAAFSTVTPLSSGNAKALSAFALDVDYGLVGGEPDGYTGDYAGRPDWKEATCRGSLNVPRYDADWVTWAHASTKLMARLDFTGPDKTPGNPYLLRFWFPRLYLDVEAAPDGPRIIRPDLKFQLEAGVSTSADVPAGFPTGQNGLSSVIVETQA